MEGMKSEKVEIFDFNGILGISFSFWIGYEL